MELGVTAKENKVSLGEEKKVLELDAVMVGLSSSVEAHLITELSMLYNVLYLRMELLKEHPG